MTNKQLLIALANTSLPKGDVRETMFEFYNSRIGTSEHFKRRENPKTACGSCIQRVKTNIWKWYHYSSDSPRYKGLEFTGRLVAHNMPLYSYNDGK